MSLDYKNYSLDNSRVPSSESYIPSTTQSGSLNKGLTTPETSMVSQGIGTAAQIGTSIATGYMQKQDNEKYRKEDLAQAEQSRKDKIKQDNFDFNLRNRAQEQEQKMFDIQKNEQSATLKHNMFIQSFKKALEGRQKLINAVKSLNGEVSKSTDIKNTLLKSFQRNK